ncbi:unknown [Fusobacterium sp. CAG:439]|nr:unknown [Fusobacterium sp. CAG:439]
MCNPFVSCQAARLAFTLAEVLVTLGIIGVISALTVPSLIQNNAEKQYAARLKKFYSLMNQAVASARLEKGDINYWGLTLAGNTTEDNLTDEQIAAGKTTVDRFWSIMSNYLKIIKHCKSDENCETYERHSLDGTHFGKFTNNVTLADGTSIVGTTVLYPKCDGVRGSTNMLRDICGEIFVDVNGSNPPNKTGVDVFIFYYGNQGVIPAGTYNDTAFSFTSHCNYSKAGSLNGYGCAGWVLQKENLDYLYCNDLSWSGKSECK